MQKVVDFIPHYVNPAKEGKKYGSIKNKNGDKLLVLKGMVDEFSPDVSVKLEVHTENWKDGPVTIVDNKIGASNGIGPKQNTRARMDPADARGAYISLMMSAFARAGKLSVNRDALAIARREIAAEYDISNSPQWRSDLKDEIPEDDWQTNSENPAD